MGSKRKLVLGSDDDDDNGDGRVEETQLDLERSIKELYQEEDADDNDHDPAMSKVRKEELISKLGEARQDEANQERKARRIAWSMEVQREMKINAEFKGIMEEVSLEEVEVGEKPRMSRMSMEWREAFKKERASFLFPQVLPTLMKLTNPHGRLRRIHELALYRLVCKASRDSVDALLSTICISPRTWRWTLYVQYHMDTLKFKNGERAKAFARKFSHAANPFFTRKIQISLPERPHLLPEFSQTMEGILRRWGEELWSAKLYLFQKTMSEELMYELLVSWLKLMPNLRAFALNISNPDQIADARLAQLWETIAKNPLPSMSHLVHIVIESSTPNPVTHAILSKFSGRLESVEVGFDMDHLQINDTLSNWSPPTPVSSEGSFSAMQQLTACYRRIGSVEDVRNIINNFNNWLLPLRRLTLTLANKRDEGFEPPLLLNNEALTGQGVFLEMPQLEELSLKLFYRIGLRTLDFLLPCKALKVLSLDIFRVDDVPNCKPIPEQDSTDDNGLFQFPTDPADNDRVYQSPIWRLLPELKLIAILVRSSLNNSTYHYTREEYLEQGMEKRRM